MYAIIEHTFEAKTAMTKGTMTTEFTVWCGCCDIWEQVSAESKTETANTVKKQGWRRTKTHGWMCPKCSGQSPIVDKLPEGTVSVSVFDLLKMPTNAYADTAHAARTDAKAEGG